MSESKTLLVARVEAVQHYRSASLLRAYLRGCFRRFTDCCNKRARLFLARWSGLSTAMPGSARDPYCPRSITAVAKTSLDRASSQPLASVPSCPRLVVPWGRARARSCFSQPFSNFSTELNCSSSCGLCWQAGGLKAIPTCSWQGGKDSQSWAAGAADPRPLARHHEACTHSIPRTSVWDIHQSV